MPLAVQSLPYVAWILLGALAYGAFVFGVVSRHQTDATVGYLRFIAISALLLALLTIPVVDSLPGLPSVPSPEPAIAAAYFASNGAFIALALAWAIAVRNRRVALVSALALMAAAVALGAMALALAPRLLDWSVNAVDAVPLLVQLAVLSLATGGSLAATVLGHWYLVTPKISERPLVLQARLLLAMVGLQVLLFIVWTTLGGGPGQGAFDAFSGSALLLVVLRLLVSLLFPLVLTWMAWRTALTRSMESATGLLYINLAAVMAGTIGAAALYVSSGLLI